MIAPIIRPALTAAVVAAALGFAVQADAGGQPEVGSAQCNAYGCFGDAVLRSRNAAEVQRMLRQDVAIFTGEGIDPIHPAGRTGADAILAPIGMTMVRVNEKDAHGLNRRGVGVGFMIAPCLMMTARHAVLGTSVPTTPIKPGYVTVTIGPEDDTMVIDDGVINFAGQGASEQVDWAIAALPLCAGQHSKVGWYILGLLSECENLHEVWMFGIYTREDMSGLRLWGQNHCAITKEISGIAFHNCASIHGRSGAPLICKRKGDGLPIVVAINLGGPIQDSLSVSEYSDINANHAITIDEIWRTGATGEGRVGRGGHFDLDGIIRDDISAQGNPANALLKNLGQHWDRP